jgi:hypothetical protein
MDPISAELIRQGQALWRAPRAFVLAHLGLIHAGALG